jgi:YbbR domain-containing protein
VRGGIFGFLVRDWPLRLAAVGLAAVLYVGLVLSQNARVWAGQIPIDAINQPQGTFLISGPGEVVSVRYIAPVDVAGQVTSRSFVATADLSGITAQMAGVPVSVPVTVFAPDRRIQVLGWEPRTVAVRLDPVISRSVPVQVDRGTVPAGLTASDPTVEPSTVTIRGPSSVVSRAAAALARVTIDASGFNVDADADLVAVDDRGEQLAPLTIDPSRAHVTIVVAKQLASRTVPVAVSVNGDLAPGYAIREIVVTPAAVTVSGEASVIANMSSIATAPLDLTGRSADLTAQVALAPPRGVSVLGGVKAQVVVRVVAETGSRSFGAGIRLLNARSDREYQLSVPDVLVTLGGTRAALDAVNPAALSATVDVSGLEAGSATLAVRFQAAPGTQLVSISPSRVTVTVTVPATPLPSSPSSPQPTAEPTPEPSFSP